MNIVFFGLGNPGLEYDNTRHNFGRMCIQKFLNDNNMQWKKFNAHGEYAKLEKNVNTYYFLRTTTLYMNESGIYLQEFLNFYKLKTSDCVILYDEMNYELGVIKLRTSGSAGGHNGMKDIIRCLNTQEIKRIRLGIGRVEKDKVINFVIGKFSHSELKIVQDVINLVSTKIIPSYMNDLNFTLLMNKFNN